MYSGQWLTSGDLLCLNRYYNSTGAAGAAIRFVSRHSAICPMFNMT